MRDADDRRNASIITHSSIRCSVDIRAGRLHDEDVGAADVLVDLERDLRVGKALQPRVPDRDAKKLTNLRREGGMSSPEKSFSWPRLIKWLGRKDSNLRIRDSKSRALPLGHAPSSSMDYAALAARWHGFMALAVRWSHGLAVLTVRQAGLRTRRSRAPHSVIGSWLTRAQITRRAVRARPQNGKCTVADVPVNSA